MKTKLTLLALALGASTCLLTAQDAPPASNDQRPPQREGNSGKPPGFHLLPPRAQEQLKLTDEQKKSFTQNIRTLSQYIQGERARSLGLREGAVSQPKQ